MSDDAVPTNNGSFTDHETEDPATERVPTDGLSADTIFELLKNGRRRQVLYYLEEEDGSAPLQELARNIAAREHDVPVSAVSTKQYKRVYVALVQTHVPKLENASVVEFDEDDQILALKSSSLRLYAHLYLESESRHPLPVDISETSDEVFVRVDLPGFERDDIQIKATDGRLDIVAERSSSMGGDETVIQRERSLTVDRSIPLPLSAVTEGADASFEGGVLEITLSKDATTTVIEIG